jgi:natural product precursor
MMSSKKLDKKLTLKKETIADLKKNEMQVIYGGGSAGFYCSFYDYCTPE